MWKASMWRVRMENYVRGLVYMDKCRAKCVRCRVCLHNCVDLSPGPWYFNEWAGPGCLLVNLV